MTPEQQLTALRMLETAARGNPNITNQQIREINIFIAEMLPVKLKIIKSLGANNDNH